MTAKTATAIKALFVFSLLFYPFGCSDNVGNAPSVQESSDTALSGNSDAGRNTETDSVFIPDSEGQSTHTDTDTGGDAGSDPGQDTGFPADTATNAYLDTTDSDDSDNINATNDTDEGIDSTSSTDGTHNTDDISGNILLDAVLVEKEDVFDNTILISQQPDLSWKPSSIYRWKDFLISLQVMANQGIAEMTFWLGEPDAAPEIQMRQGLVNIAAFLAQSMKETIQYDACDENNWDNTNGYRISNACGQLGQNYADYDCDMACPRDPDMAMSAVTHAKWFGAPGPMFCAPDSRLIELGLSTDGTTGHWSIGKDCWPYPATESAFAVSDDPPYLRPACEVYAGQKGGEWVWDGSGTSVEGCCWWGRGVIQTTGRCNFGKLNHYLGNTHLDANAFPAPAQPLYPDVDFCQNPEAICSSTAHPELKWIAGLFYWMNSVQTYEADGWQYETALKAFVDGGLEDDSFINAISGIVNRGCHNPPCATGAVDGGTERLENFEKVLSAMGII
ncbi:MAG: hypothetical protein JXR76_27725 [Deltaproteobacteria bacterium]|nr:hypothetical protein [Deltaproteobacteria bacterium]